MVRSGPVRSRARNTEIIFLHIHPRRARSRMHGIIRRPVVSSLSLFLAPLLSFSLDGTPRLRGKSDIFRHGIWRSNDARAKLSTSIRLFVPNWPSATPANRFRNPRRNWKVSFCSSARFIPLPSPAKFATHLSIYLVLSLSLRGSTGREGGAPDLNTIDAFLRRANPRKPKRVPRRFIALAPCDCTFTLKAPVRTNRSRRGLFQYRSDALTRGKPARRTICEKHLKIRLELLRLFPQISLYSITIDGI